MPRRLALRSIRSPVGGVIVEILLVRCESVDDRAREIIVIAELNPLNVEIILPAEQIGWVRVGTPFEVTPLLPGEPIRQTSVSVVDHKIDAASDTFGVQLQRENADYTIPGSIRCDIEFSSLDVVTTPCSVVGDRGGFAQLLVFQ